MDRFVSVAVPVPALDLLTYRLPEALPVPVAGARVDVPLGARRVTGIVVEAPVDPPEAQVRVRDVVAVRDTSAFVPPGLLALALWVADYYLAGPGDVLATALPPRVLTGDERTFRRRRLVALTAAGGTPPSRRGSARAARRRATTAPTGCGWDAGSVRH